MLLPSENFFIDLADTDCISGCSEPGGKGTGDRGCGGKFLLMSGRDKKNPALRLALGAYDLYNITGWLSDVLSYSRLLALGLATGVIASVINQMGSMLPNNIAGVNFVSR